MIDLTKLTDADLIAATPANAQETVSAIIYGIPNSRAHSGLSEVPFLDEARRRSQIVEHTDFTSESA